MTDLKVEAEVVPAGEIVQDGIVLAKPDKIEILPKQIHEWKSVKYMMQADIVIRGMRDPQCRQVMGRAIGEREDGKPFSMAVYIPWMMPEDYDWKVKARSRLDTFLMDLCKCEAAENEVIICDWHKSLAGPWGIHDHMEIVHLEGHAPGDMPNDKTGPVMPWQLMNRMYPWARYSPSTQEWICMMCGSHADAMDNNSTWRNQFISKHSHCGFVDPTSILPASIEDKVLNELGKRLEEKFNQTGMMAYDNARAFVLNQRGTLVVADERKPKELEGK